MVEQARAAEPVEAAPAAAAPAEAIGRLMTDSDRV